MNILTEIPWRLLHLAFSIHQGVGLLIVIFNIAKILLRKAKKTLAMKNNLAILIDNMKHTKHTIEDVKYKSIPSAISGRIMRLPIWVLSFLYKETNCAYERIIGERRSYLNQLDNTM